MKRICFAAWLLLGTACAHAQPAPVTQPCRNDKISNNNGSQISLASGLSYQSYPGSNATLSTWLPLDRVTVCPISGIAVQITDISQKGQTIKALRILAK